MVEPAFRILLAGDTDVAAVIGERCYFNVRPQDERRPCLTITRVSTFIARRFSGGSGATKGRIQVDVFAATYQQVKELTAKVRQRLDGYTGTVADTRFFYIEVEDERDLPAAPLEGQATPLYATSIDCRFLHAT